MQISLKKVGGRVVVVAAVIVLMGCESIPTVKPWQKGNLARPEMTFDPDPLEGAYANHIYFSKEGASGGYGIGGGGCGCN